MLEAHVPKKNKSNVRFGLGNSEFHPQLLICWTTFEEVTANRLEIGHPPISYHWSSTKLQKVKLDRMWQMLNYAGNDFKNNNSLPLAHFSQIHFHVYCV